MSGNGVAAGDGVAVGAVGDRVAFGDDMLLFAMVTSNGSERREVPQLHVQCKPASPAPQINETAHAQNVIAMCRLCKTDKAGCP